MEIIEKIQEFIDIERERNRTPTSIFLTIDCYNELLKETEIIKFISWEIKTVLGLKIIIVEEMKIMSVNKWGIPYL